MEREAEVEKERNRERGGGGVGVHICYISLQRRPFLFCIFVFVFYCERWLGDSPADPGSQHILRAHMIGLLVMHIKRNVSQNKWSCLVLCNPQSSEPNHRPCRRTGPAHRRQQSLLLIRLLGLWQEQKHRTEWKI